MSRTAPRLYPSRLPTSLRNDPTRHAEVRLNDALAKSLGSDYGRG